MILNGSQFSPIYSPCILRELDITDGSLQQDPSTNTLKHPPDFKSLIVSFMHSPPIVLIIAVVLVLLQVNFLAISLSGNMCLNKSLAWLATLKAMLCSIRKLHHNASALIVLSPCPSTKPE